MQGILGRVVPIWTLLALLSSTKANDGQSKYIKQGKGSEERSPFEISYISKPRVSTIDVVCRTYLASNFQITCPAFDGKGVENNFVASKAVGTCEKTVKYFRGQRCIRMVCRISWKQFGTDFFNFTCFCGIKLHSGNHTENGVSVKIINQSECKGNTKVFRRKLNAQKNVRISCCITGQPPPEITWYKDEFALNIPNGNAIINNVRYQQKGARLLISRTDVYGSGSYQCLARNSAGHETGDIFRITFYKSKTNKSSNGSKHNVIASTPLTATTHVEATEMALTFPRNSSTHAPHEAGNFLRNTNETTDNEEEEEENETQNREDEFLPALILIGAVTISGICLLGLLVTYRCGRKKHLSTDLNEQRSQPVTPTCEQSTSVPVHVVLCGARDEARKSFRTSSRNDSIDEKLVNFDDELKTNFKESKRCPLSLDSPSTKLLSYLPVTSAFNPSPQSMASTSSKIDEAAVTHLVHPNVFAPLVSTASCSSPIEDTEDILKEPSTFCPINLMTESDLSVDGSEVFLASMPSPDLSIGSNISELLDKLITVPPNADERNFSSTLIDHNGGEVILAGTGIKLVIPQGAIDEGKTEVVHLALLGNPEYAPKELRNNDTSLTPVVMCGPHGLRFKKHVMLVLPHCVAVSDKTKENFRVLCSDTAPEIAPDWKEIFNNKDKPDKDVFGNMGEQRFHLFLRHFSWYNIRGEGRARNFSIQAYHTTLHQPGEEFKVRIYFVPILRDSYVGQKRVDEAEEKLNGTLSDGRKVKIFHKKGGDIIVEAIEISEGWLVKQNIQTQNHKALSVCREESPNHTFRFKHVTQRPEEVSCTFRISQANCKFDSPVDISMSLHFKSEIRRAQFQKRNDNERQAWTTSQSSGFVESGESMMTAAFITVKLQKDLSQLLDPDTFGVSNWKDLAEHLDCDLKLIRWLDRRRIESPTEKLLMHWENTVDYERPEDALAFLQQKLCEIGRKDASIIVEEHLRSQRKLSSTAFMV